VAVIQSDPGEAGLIDDLTPRQLEVLACLARGLSNRQIGDDLGISVRTVEGHLDNVYDHLGVRSRAGVMYLLASTGALYQLPVIGRNG
jgi:DNA-binding NarL/FixJ family response regulator